MKKRFFSVALLFVGLVGFAQEARNDIAFDDEYFQKKKVKADYTFSVTYRLAADYLHLRHYSKNTSYPDLYLNGGRLGFTVDFNLPYHTSIQTGLFYQMAYGNTTQHWRNTPPAGQHIQESNEVLYLNHKITEYQAVIPIRATYTQKLWKELALWFYAGPQMVVGLACTDKIENHLNAETEAWLRERQVRMESYDMYKEKELRRFDLQISLGGGIQWASYRLLAGYDFGVVDLAKSKRQKMWEWNWFIGFSYGF